MNREEEEAPESPKMELKRRPSTNPSTPHNLFNLPLFSKKHADLEDNEPKTNGFQLFPKKDLIEPRKPNLPQLKSNK